MAKPDLKSRISAWRNGSDGFFKWIADTKPMIPSEKGGYEPYTVPNDEVREAIRQALDGGFATVVFCWPRRHGKTVVSALIVVWRFLTRRTQTVAIVANSERQSVDTAFKLAKTIIEQTPYSKLLVDEGSIKVGADSIAYEALGNVIQGFPANAASLYGKKLSVAQVSELHAARTDVVYQTLASSTIDTDDGLVLVDSTTGSRSSPLFTLAQVAERGADDRHGENSDRGGGTLLRPGLGPNHLQFGRQHQESLQPLP
ncbi:terminase large subunit [Magnetospirillum sp. 15-1]|uniref:terminase large subunit domain-containing protein n=1 Tax=Magnetospirillum sp. 15-1 TaxID=1979370 RepID=UPI001142957A|nr:terminase large subunit [Magnetospirillum sp. 15-1]